jgi:hypothetical protein
MSAVSESPFRTQEAAPISEYFEPETPFLDTRFASEAWEQRESPPSGNEREQQWSPQLETPFASHYHGEAPVNLEAQMVEQALTDFFDHDFNEAVANLAMEASAQAQQFAGGAGETYQSMGEAQTQQMLAEWIDPLREAMEQMFERIGTAASQQQMEHYTEPELEAFFESYAPPPGIVGPEFEDFFKKAWRKLKKIGSGVLNVVKKGVAMVGKLAMPIGFLFKKLGRLVRPLLNRVIRFALGKLPASLRPAATLLGKRLGILNEMGYAADEAFPTGEVPTAPEAEAIAYEFDAQVAMLMFARDDNEGEVLLNEVNQETQGETETNSLAELDAARERFVGDFSRLQPQESAQPVIQQFIPALLPLLRVGITVVGRSRVVNFLAGYLAKLVQPYIGGAAATALSRALVDVGLRTITLEAEAEPEPRMAARSVAALLEDTVRRINDFGFQNFDNFGDNLEQQQMLETVATEAFFESAIAHFPAELLDGARLAEREMYFETSGEAGVWAYKPRPRYKKYSRVFEVKITPQIAGQLRTFGDQPLAVFLRAHNMKLPAKVRIHLYEAIPGTLLSQIALLERRTPGLGSGSVAAFSKIHPLTTQAAGLLLKEPSLGRDVGASYLASRSSIAVGQRFYYIEVTQGSAAGPRGGRASEVNLTIDLPSNQVRVSVFFSEADAQRIVATGPTASAMTAVRIAQGMVSAAIASLSNGGVSNHVRFNREATGELEGEEFLGALAGQAAKRVAMWLLQELAKVLVQMVKAALIRYFNGRMAEFTTATRNPADGVTLVLVFSHPGLQVLRAALAGRVPGLADVRAAARKLQLPSAAIVAGFARR